MIKVIVASGAQSFHRVWIYPSDLFRETDFSTYQFSWYKNTLQWFYFDGKILFTIFIL